MMTKYTCTCGGPIFFANFECLQCHNAVGRCSACDYLATFIETNEGLHCSRCFTEVRACANRENSICNVFAPLDHDSHLCPYCQTTKVVPNLEKPENVTNWRRLESAKRRLLLQLKQLCLPPFAMDMSLNKPLHFLFLEDEITPTEIIRHYTGHREGDITINIAEADSTFRESTRVRFGEPQRTLIGHMRHEIGHYLDYCFSGTEAFAGFPEVFGDPSAQDYAAAQQVYYSKGPPSGWQKSHTSAYATMHPSEDFAETVNLYLDLMAIADTAAEFGVAGIQFNPETEIGDLVPKVLELAVLITEFNFDMGLGALLPESVSDAVMKKLSFVHQLQQSALSGVNSI